MFVCYSERRASLVKSREIVDLLEYLFDEGVVLAVEDITELPG